MVSSLYLSKTSGQGGVMTQKANAYIGPEATRKSPYRFYFDGEGFDYTWSVTDHVYDRTQIIANDEIPDGESASISVLIETNKYVPNVKGELRVKVSCSSA